MSALTICKKDPLLDYIRHYYDAHPMRVPDQRIKPMTWITVVDKRHRYIGPISDSIVSDNWDAPPLFEADLPGLETQSSRSASLKVVMGLLGPFVSMMLGKTIVIDLEAIAAAQVSVSLEGARREYVTPGSLHKALEGKPLRHPLPIDGPWKLYVVDSVLTARRVTIRETRSRGANVGMAMMSQLEGFVSSDALLGGPESLTIAGTDVPFAFTCLAMNIEQHTRMLSTLTPASRKGFAFASGGSGGTDLRHAAVGEANEFIGFG